MALRRLVDEKFEIEINEGRDKFEQYHFADKIAENLRGYIRKESFFGIPGENTISTFDVPSLPGGRIYVNEIRDEELAISCGFRPKAVKVRLEYLENPNLGDLAQIKLGIKNSLKINNSDNP